MQVALPPGLAAGDGPRIRVYQNAAGIKAVQEGGIIGLTVHAKPIFQFMVNSRDQDMPYMACPMKIGVQRELDEGLFLALGKENEVDPCRGAGKDGKVDTAAERRGAKGLGQPS